MTLRRDNVITYDVHGTMGCGKKSFNLVWQSPQLLIKSRASGLLSRVPRLFVIDKVDETGGCVQICGIFISSEENLNKEIFWRLYDQSSPQMGYPKLFL